MNYYRKLHFKDGYVHTFEDYSKKILEKAKVRTLVTQHGQVIFEEKFVEKGSDLK